MKTRLLILFLLLLRITYGQKTTVDQVFLDKIEKRVYSNPDSCVKIIRNCSPLKQELYPRFLFLKATSLLYSNSFDSAWFYFLKVQPLLKNDNRYSAYINYSLGYLSYHKGDDVATMKYYRISEQISKNISDNYLKSILNTQIGTYFIDKNIIDSAFYYCNLALEYAKIQGEKAKIATAYNNLSIACYKSGDYEKAIEWQISAIKTKEQLGDTISLATSLNNVGSFFVKIKKFDDANRYLIRAFRMLKGTTKLAGFSALNLGVCFKMTGQYDSAILYYGKALDIYKKLGLESNIGKVYSNLGGVYEAKNNLPKALEFMLKALEVSKKQKNDFETALRNRNVANVYLLQNKPQLAKPYIFEAHKQAEGLKSIELNMEVSSILSKYYEKTNMPLLALKYYKEFKEWNDSLYNEGSQKTITELTTKYETEKKEG